MRPSFNYSTTAVETLKPPTTCTLGLLPTRDFEILNYSIFVEQIIENSAIFRQINNNYNNYNASHLHEPRGLGVLGNLLVQGLADDDGQHLPIYFVLEAPPGPELGRDMAPVPPGIKNKPSRIALHRITSHQFTSHYTNGSQQRLERGGLFLFSSPRACNISAVR